MVNRNSHLPSSQFQCFETGKGLRCEFGKRQIPRKSWKSNGWQLLNLGIAREGRRSSYLVRNFNIGMLIGPNFCSGDQLGILLSKR